MPAFFLSGELFRAVMLRVRVRGKGGMNLKTWRFKLRILGRRVKNNRQIARLHLEAGEPVIGDDHFIIIPLFPPDFKGLPCHLQNFFQNDGEFGNAGLIIKVSFLMFYDYL